MRTLWVMAAASPSWVPALTAQQSLLERWAVDYLVDSWRPGWVETHADDDGRYSWGPRGVAFHSRFDRLSLGSIDQSWSYGSIGVRRPIGGSSHRVRATVSSRAGGVAHGGHSVLAMENSPAVAVGAELALPALAAARWSIDGFGTWDRGPGAIVGVVGDHAWYRLAVHHSRTNAASARMLFQADSLRDLGARHRMVGTSMEAVVFLPVAGARLGGGIAAAWDDMRHTTTARTSFLAVSPQGHARERTLRLLFEDPGEMGVELLRRAHAIDLDGDITRRGVSAGRLFFGRMEYERWSLEVWRTAGDHEWRWTVGMDELASALSARVETWPFLTVWEQLGAQAFRFRGAVNGKAVWTRVAHLPTADGGRAWGWGVDVGLYDLKMTTEDWFVTSFGISRSEQDSTVGGASPAVVLGATAAKDIRVLARDLLVDVTAGLPVYARRTGSGSQTRDIAWYAGIGFSWLW